MKKKVITWIIVVAVVGGLIGLRINSANKKKYISVKTSSASIGDVKSYLSTTVTIKSKQSKDYYGPQSKVLKLNVKVGDAVKKGDILVTYDVQDPNLQINQAQIAYDNAVSQKNDTINQNKLNASKLSDLNVDAQLSDYNNRLNIVNNKISALEAEVNSLKNSTNANDVTTVNNDKTQLYSSAPAQLFPGQQAGASLYALRDSLNSTINSLKNTKYTLQPASEEKLKQLDNAIANAKLSLDNAKNNAGKTQTNITADFDGVVTAVNAIEGQTGTMTSPAISVQDINNLKGVAMVGKYDLDKLKVEDAATIKTSNKEIKGKVSFIAPTASKAVSSTTGENTIEVDVDVMENASALKIDLDQDVDILLGEKDGVIKIPAEAIKSDKTGRNFVYIIENNKAVEKTVTLGLQSDVDVEIINGIKAGDKVILNPNANIQNGSIVKEGLGGK